MRARNTTNRSHRWPIGPLSLHLATGDDRRIAMAIHKPFSCPDPYLSGGTITPIGGSLISSLLFY